MLYYPIEPYTPWVDHLERWLDANKVETCRKIFEGVFHLGYPDEYHARVVQEELVFKAAVSWATALDLHAILKKRLGEPISLLVLYPMLETLYLTEGVSAELCDTCGVLVPELILNHHQHLRTT